MNGVAHTNKDVGRVPSAPGSHPPGHAASGVDGAPRFDPSRGGLRLKELLARASPRPWLIHSEPDVNYPPTIHAVSDHRLGGVGDPIEPLSGIDQELIVEAINSLPSLLNALEVWQTSQAGPLFSMTLSTLESHYYEDADLARWLQAPQPLFDGKTPLELLAEGRKAELYQSIRQMDEGTYT